MNYLIRSEESLVLRDGRPFGEDEHFSGGSNLWPLPQTVAGMLRTKAGFSVSDEFFKDKNNIARIKELPLNKLIPKIKKADQWSALAPVPADLVFTQVESDDKSLTVNPLTYKLIGDDCGTDIRNRDWLIPSVDLKEKPAKGKPFFLHWNFFEKYIAGELSEATTEEFSDLGIKPPITEERLHNAISAETGTSRDGSLFCNKSVYLKSQNGKKVDDLAIHFETLDPDKNYTVEGEAYLGGERRKVSINQSDSSFPACPDVFKNKRFLKLVLTTHGDFGSWCPDWLETDLQADTIDWVNIPGTDYKVRLRSACVFGWEAVSGWDYEMQKPKAMRKLVRPGTVYLIELQNPDESSEISNSLWGKSINYNSLQSQFDGFGQIIIANESVK